MRLKVLDHRILAFAALGAIILAPTYYILAKLIVGVTALTTTAAHTFFLAFVFLFCYELYFAVQRTDLGRRIYIVHTDVDDAIPFVSAWVWVYGLLYYPLISFPIALLLDHRRFLLFVSGAIFILLCSIPVYLLWPTRCPTEWRTYPTQHTSARYLSFIQHFDNGRCCIPSLHVALSAYASTFYPSNTAFVIVPGLVSVSCLLVKQHSILDIAPSLIFGFAIAVGVNTVM